MKAKKLFAVLGVLFMAIPSAAYAANAQNSVTTEIVEGHTVFAAVVQETKTNFAAVAGIAAKRTTIGGVLWFNDQELIPASVAAEESAGNWVIAVESGDDSPDQHLDANYTESYQFTDPNNRVWIVDRYTYDSCYVDVAGSQQIVPCDATAANQGVDLTGSGQPTVSTGCVDVSQNGTCTVPVADNIHKQTKSLFVVQIGATTPDTASNGCGAATGQNYNFVLLVRMDALYSVTKDGADFGSNSTATPLQGNSAASGNPNRVAPDGTHDTAQMDLYFEENRPPAPAVRTMMFPADASGSTAPCATGA